MRTVSFTFVMIVFLKKEHPSPIEGMLYASGSSDDTDGYEKPRNAKHSGVGGRGWRTTKTPTQRELADLAL